MSYGSYSSCDACGPFQSFQSNPGYAGRPTFGAGEISYATMSDNGSQRECGLASALPGVGLSMYATPFVEPCGHREMSNRMNGDAAATGGSATSVMGYNWRQDAARIPTGVIFRGLSTARRAGAPAPGMYGSVDPWNYSQRERKTSPFAPASLSALLTPSGLTTNLNYAASKPQEGCNPADNTLFNQTCQPAPGAYGTYKPFGVEPDYNRDAPYRAVFSTPSLNPEGFSVLPEPVDSLTCRK